MASGTFGSLWAIGWIWLARELSAPWPFGAPVLALSFVFIIGVWSAGRAETAFGHDSSKIIIDEMLGMWVALLFMPWRGDTVAGAFLLFRLFDIIKPFPIRRLERVPGGWGIMLDDLAAGICANVLVQGYLLVRTAL
jgi:phosphatidylglycerophosphatase A